MSNLRSLRKRYKNGDYIPTSELEEILPKLENTADVLLTLGSEFHLAFAEINHMIIQFKQWLYIREEALREVDRLMEKQPKCVTLEVGSFSEEAKLASSYPKGQAQDKQHIYYPGENED